MFDTYCVSPGLHEEEGNFTHLLIATFCFAEFSGYRYSRNLLVSCLLFQIHCLFMFCWVLCGCKVLCKSAKVFIPFLFVRISTCFHFRKPCSKVNLHPAAFLYFFFLPVLSVPPSLASWIKLLGGSEMWKLGLVGSTYVSQTASGYSCCFN